MNPLSRGRSRRADLAVGAGQGFDPLLIFVAELSDSLMCEDQTTPQ